MPVQWCDYKPYQALEAPTSLMFLYLGRVFFGGSKPGSATIRGHLYCVTVSDHCFMVPMTFPTCAFPSRELHIEGVPGLDALMRVGSCGDIQISLLQHIQDFVRKIKIQDMVIKTSFDPVLSLLAMRRLEEMNWAGEGCFR